MSETASLVTALIEKHLVCIDCIMLKTNTSRAAVDAALATIRTVLKLHSEDRGRCRGCGNIGVVISLALPPAR